MHRGGALTRAASLPIAAPAAALPEIPGYVIERVLGSGGMGTVYAARRSADGEAVALKVLNPSLNEQLRARFEQEGRILLTLDHPDIVAVHETGCTDAGVAWIAMEYLDGFDLATAMHDPSFVFRDRLEVLTRVARALQHAHDSDIVHRDVKPANIFLTRDGGVRLLDFGIAKLEDRKITQPGILNGTPEYMPPENVLGQGFDHRGDIFGLGVVAYELLSGGTPWPRNDPNATLVSIVVVPPQPFRDIYARRKIFGIPPEIVEELHAVIHKAIEGDRTKRFPSMSAFAKALEHVAERALAGEVSAGTATPKLPDDWAARRLDWARARAARLVRESAPRAPAVVAGGGVTRAVEARLRSSQATWRWLVAGFVAALGLVVYLIWK